MTQDLITVVTPTLGDSAGHLNRQMIDLRAFTRLPFRQVVSDDGTLDVGQRGRQRAVVAHQVHKWDAVWTENPGPVWGISYNFNHALSKVTTPWVLLVEDGLRPGLGWLETAVDAVNKLGTGTWRGHRVGMIGTASFNDWHLALAGALPNPAGLSVMDYLHRTTVECYSSFWGSARHPNWNDGLWCWKRLWPGFVRSCNSPESDGWPRTPAPWNFVHLVRYGRLPETQFSPQSVPTVGTNIDADAALLASRPPVDFNEVWPRCRRAGPAWFPGAFALVNMEAYHAVGKFRDGCPFFEGHFGIRLARAGWLSLFAEFPPWLHFGGMGFINGPSQARSPRHHEATDGDNEHDIFYRDFGCNGPSHVNAYKLVYETFPPELQTQISNDLREVQLYMAPEWESWL